MIGPKKKSELVELGARQAQVGELLGMSGTFHMSLEPRGTSSSMLAGFAPVLVLVVGVDWRFRGV